MTTAPDDGSLTLSYWHLGPGGTTSTDENGTVFTNGYDVLGRRTDLSAAPAAGVGDVDQTFFYDGLSRLVTTLDSNGTGGSSSVGLFYDSLNRVVEDQQDNLGDTLTRYVTGTAFDSYPMTECTYPNGRTTLNTFDILYRRTEVEESPVAGESSSSGAVPIATWEFFGQDRVAECHLGNGLIGTHMNNARTHSAVQTTVPNPAWGSQSSDRLGFDGASREITKRWLAGGIDGTTHAYNNTSAVVGVTTAYDKTSNKFYERELHAESRSHLYEPVTNGVVQGGYDSIDRLRQYQRGNLATGGGSISGAIALPNSEEDRAYDLDGLGNWHHTDYTPQGAAKTVLELRQHNGLNEITRTTVDDQVAPAVQTDFSYDGTTGASNGNLTDDGVRTYKYDALNRLIEVKKKSSSAVVGTYQYDALSRRIRKTISVGGLSGNIPNGTIAYLYQGMQCLEERDPDSTNDDTLRQYVWGIYIDELIQQLEYVPETSSSSSSGSSSSSELSSSSSSSSGSSSSPSSSSSSSESSGGPMMATAPLRRANFTRSTFLAMADEFTRVPYYPLCDLLYRTVALTDESGDIIQTYDTDSYGNTLIFTGPGSGNDWWANDAVQGEEPTCRFIFTGRRYDPETEIYFYRARYYVPALGRFLSRDPLGISTGPNLYEYVANAPTSFLDPYGLSKWKWVPFDHHWLSQSKEMQELFEKSKCGPWLNSFGIKPTDFIHWFTTTFGPGWGPQLESRHTAIHYHLKSGRWNDTVAKIYKDSKSCCELLKKVRDAILDAMREIYGVPGSVTLPHFHFYTNAP